MQRAIALASPDVQRVILERIKLHTEELKRDNCGKKVLAKLVKTYRWVFDKPAN